MRREIRIGSISWQSNLPTPFGIAGLDLDMKPAWVPLIYLMHKATSNPGPPAQIGDFRAFQETRQFRALTSCRCTVETADTTGELLDFRIHEAIHDAGWTPAFRYAESPPAWMQTLYANPALRDPEWHPGEASALSGIAAGPHGHSALQAIPPGAQALVSGVIKCRPGSRADDTCIGLGSPFHVPWIWHEWLLMLEAGQLKLHVRGSRHPSHAWYVDGRQVMSIAGLGDAAFPEEPPPPALIRRGMFVTVPPPRTGKWIQLGRLALYAAVLSQGAPASDPQTPNGPAELNQQGPLPGHANTVAGWRTSVVPL